MAEETDPQISVLYPGQMFTLPLILVAFVVMRAIPTRIWSSHKSHILVRRPLTKKYGHPSEFSAKWQSAMIYSFHWSATEPRQIKLVLQ